MTYYVTSRTLYLFMNLFECMPYLYFFTISHKARFPKSVLDSKNLSLSLSISDSFWIHIYSCKSSLILSPERQQWQQCFTPAVTFHLVASAHSPAGPNKERRKEEKRREKAASSSEAGVSLPVEAGIKRQLRFRRPHQTRAPLLLVRSSVEHF